LKEIPKTTKIEKIVRRHEILIKCQRKKEIVCIPFVLFFLFFFLKKKIQKKKENAEKREDECLENVTVGHK